MRDQSSDLKLALEQLQQEKGLSQEEAFSIMNSALQEAFRRLGLSYHGLELRPDGDTIRLYRKVTVRNSSDNSEFAVPLELARNHYPGASVGDQIYLPVSFDVITRSIVTYAKKLVLERLRDTYVAKAVDRLRQTQGEIVGGRVSYFDEDTYVIDLGYAQGLLNVADAIPGETFRQGEYIKALVKKTLKGSAIPRVKLSRQDPEFVVRLLEIEVPELVDGNVIIKKVVRKAGVRTKIAVDSTREEVDPVGSCIGVKRMRIEPVLKELKGEHVDIVRWSGDPATFITNALQPATVIKVVLDRSQKTAHVIVPNTELSLAIGKEGHNAMLTAKLTGWKIDIVPESEKEKTV
jgi:N utilization substance protein A